MTGSRAPAAWGALLLVSGAVLAIWAGSLLAAAPLLAAGVAGLAIGAAARGPRTDRDHVAGRAGAGAAVAAVALTLMLLGVAAGLWVTLIGAGLLLVAGAALIRERLP